MREITRLDWKFPVTSPKEMQRWLYVRYWGGGIELTVLDGNLGSSSTEKARTCVVVCKKHIGLLCPNKPVGFRLEASVRRRRSKCLQKSEPFLCLLHFSSEELKLGSSPSACLLAPSCDTCPELN